MTKQNAPTQRRVKGRKSAKVLNQGYGSHGANAEKTSLAGWIAAAGSAIEDIERNVDQLRTRSRDLYMGSPLAAGALKAIRTSVVGSGLKLNAQPDHEYLGMTQEEAEEWSSKVEREFSHWADSINCDAQRMNNFYELQQLAFLSWLMSGDVFSLLPIIKRKGAIYDTRIYLIEADRIDTPNDSKGVSYFNNKIINGVEIADFGEVIAYHIAQHHPNSIHFSAPQEWKRVLKFGEKTGRQNIIHLMESERPEQRRGVPILAPVIESLKQLSRYTEAELMAAVVNGFYTVFIKSQSPDEGPYGPSIPDDMQVDDEDDGTYELGSGSVVGLAPGEEIQESNPSRPNQNFDGFVTSICRQIGTALEIPYEVLLKHFTSSYSASRGALMEAWKMYKMRRAWLANDFCQPIYEEWLSEAVAKGRVEAPGFFDDPLMRKAYCAAEWTGPSQGQLDPLKEVNAAEKRVKGGFSTRTRETTELTGTDWKTNHRKRVMEEKLREEGGLKQGEPNQSQPTDPPASNQDDDREDDSDD